jgi:hypothetical protein
MRGVRWPHRCIEFYRMGINIYGENLIIIIVFFIYFCGCVRTLHGVYRSVHDRTFQ